VLLGLRVRDLTGGFKAYRRAVLEALPLDEIDSKGYAFQIETTYRAVRKGFTVREVPIVFVDRVEGGSKDEPFDRARGDLEGAGAATRRPARKARWLMPSPGACR